MDAEQATKVMLGEQIGHGIEVFRSSLSLEQGVPRVLVGISDTMDLVM